jgi:hypothetical protein
VEGVRIARYDATVAGRQLDAAEDVGTRTVHLSNGHVAGGVNGDVLCETLFI